MVKAYKDNFLMSSKPLDECFGMHCSAGTGDDDSPKPAGTADQKHALAAADAPTLDYDLEAELAQALNAEPGEVTMLEPEISAPSMEFSGLIEDEFDKAMKEQAVLLEQEAIEDVAKSEKATAVESIANPVVESERDLVSSTAPVELPKVADMPIEDAAQTIPTAADNNSAFADQLARLLSEQDTSPAEDVSAPSIGEADLAAPVAASVSEPASSPEVATKTPPKLPVFMPETSEPEIVEVAQPEEVVEIVDPPRDYSDPAAEFQTFAQKTAADIPAPAPVVPEPFRPAFDNKPIESVIGASAALGAAALATSNASAKEQPIQLPPASTFESADADIDAEFDGSFREPFDAHEGELIIPSTDMLGPRTDRGTGGRKVAFAVLAVALLGGVGALASNYLGNSAADTPVLMADGGAVKVKPKEAGGEVVPNQDQTVYQTVNGTSQQPAQKTLADNTEKPIEMAKATPVKGESRVSDTEVPASNTTGRLQPKTVRTSVVKPDGTIIMSDAETGTSGVDLARLQPESTTNLTKVKTVSVSPNVTGGQSGSETVVTPETSTDGAAKSVMPKGVLEIRANNADEATSAPKPAGQIEPVKPVEIAKVETKAPKTVTKRVAAKKVKPVAKARVAPKVQKPAAAETNLPTVSSPYAVQISSRRSPESAQAAWRQLSRKYASVLRGQSPDIRRVNIEGKGVYYRVRVPASSKAKAGSICAKLKKRGGSCFVTR